MKGIDMLAVELMKERCYIFCQVSPIRLMLCLGSWIISNLQFLLDFEHAQKIPRLTTLVQSFTRLI